MRKIALGAAIADFAKLAEGMRKAGLRIVIPKSISTRCCG
jgi:hypothetical protein